jgi:hypothetical protein
MRGGTWLVKNNERRERGKCIWTMKKGMHAERKGGRYELTPHSILSFHPY